MKSDSASLTKAEKAIDFYLALTLALLLILPYARAFWGGGLSLYVFPFILILVGFLCKQLFFGVHFSRFSLIYIGVSILTVAYFFLSILWTESSEKYLVNAVQVALWLPLILVTMVAFSRTSTVYFFYCYILFGVIIAFDVLAGYSAAGDLSGYSAAVAESYLVAGATLGGAATLAAGMFFFTKSKIEKAFVTLSFLVLFLAVSFSLARGALLFSVFCTLSLILILGIYEKRMVLIRKGIFFFKPIAFFLGVALVFSISFFVFVAFNVERTGARLQRLFFGDELAEGGRGYIWSNGLESFFAHPIFGYGLGSSGIYSAGVEGAYPHNFLLQALLDGGLVGFIAIFFTIIVAGALSFFVSMRSRNYFFLVPWFVFLYFVLEYSKSGDFYSARPLLVFLCLSLNVLKKENSQNSNGGFKG